MEYTWDRASMRHNLEGFRETMMPLSDSIKVLPAVEGDHTDVGVVVSHGEGVGGNESGSRPQLYEAQF